MYIGLLSILDVCKLKFDGHAVVFEGFSAQLLKMKLELDVRMSWKRRESVLSTVRSTSRQ